MSTAQKTAEREEIVSALNINPNRFLKFVGQEERVIVNGKSCLVVRDKIRGGIVVWGVDATFNFNWNDKRQEWF